MNETREQIIERATREAEAKYPHPHDESISEAVMIAASEKAYIAGVIAEAERRAKDRTRIAELEKEVDRTTNGWRIASEQGIAHQQAGHRNTAEIANRGHEITRLKEALMGAGERAAKDRELLQMAADALADPHKMSKGAEALSALKDAGITPTEA